MTLSTAPASIGLKDPGFLLFLCELFEIGTPIQEVVGIVTVGEICTQSSFESGRFRC